MAQPYLGEIKIFAGNFAPLGWAFCNGELLSISENDALFNLIGTTYGGDGQVTFALPDLRSRVPLGMGTGNGLTGRPLGQPGGAETVTLNTSQLPAHTHVPFCNAGSGESASPSNNFWAGNAASSAPQYSSVDSSLSAMNPALIGPTGGNQPHENRIPFLSLNFIIALNGIYPSPN